MTEREIEATREHFEAMDPQERQIGRKVLMEGLQERITEVRRLVCDGYCRWPQECQDQEELETDYCYYCSHFGVIGLLNEISGEAEV